MNRLRRHERGQVIALAAAAMVVLLGFVAIAVDVGLLWTERRQMQTAADAAAVAAAIALRSSDNIQTAGQNAAALNSFTNGQNSATVTINNPPLAGAYAGNSNYVEAVVSQPETTYFLRVLGSAYNTVNVSTRAVSGAIAGPSCMYALDPTKSGTIDVTGNFTVSAACGVMDDSNSSSAFTPSGNGTFTATSIGIVGDEPNACTGNVTCKPAPVVNIAPAPDPLGGRQEPTVTDPSLLATTSSTPYSINGNITNLAVPAGIYKDNGSGGISIGGNIGTATFTPGSVNYGNGIFFTSANVTNLVFNPGQYQSGSKSCSADSSFDNSNPASICLSGNIGSAVFNPGNYTFYGPVEINGNTSVTLSPGTYYGGISITGNNATTFQPGVYVLAGGGLKYTGNSTMTGTGVTFYDTSGLGGYGPIDLTGNETANLSAPTSGLTEGMLFFQDRTIATGSAASTVTGNSSSAFDGVVYFPTTGLTFTGNSSSTGYTYLIADTITMTGNINVTIGNDTSSLAHGSPIKSSALYE